MEAGAEPPNKEGTEYLKKTYYRELVFGGIFDTYIVIVYLTI